MYGGTRQYSGVEWAHVGLGKRSVMTQVSVSEKKTDIENGEDKDGNKKKSTAHMFTLLRPVQFLSNLDKVYSIGLFVF